MTLEFFVLARCRWFEEDVWKHIITSVLFVRWFLDIEQLQSHHVRQFLVTFIRCRVTNNRVQTFWQITTEGQGYLDELASDGKTAPKAAMTGSCTFRNKCGDDGFHQDSLRATGILPDILPLGAGAARPVSTSCHTESQILCLACRSLLNSSTTLQQRTAVMATLQSH